MTNMTNLFPSVETTCSAALASLWQRVFVIYWNCEQNLAAHALEATPKAEVEALESNRAQNESFPVFSATPLRMQMEQLHLRPLVISSHVNLNRTASQCSWPCTSSSP